MFLLSFAVLNSYSYFLWLLLSSTLSVEETLKMLVGIEIRSHNNFGASIINMEKHWSKRMRNFTVIQLSNALQIFAGKIGWESNTNGFCWTIINEIGWRSENKAAQHILFYWCKVYDPLLAFSTALIRGLFAPTSYLWILKIL